MFRRLWGTWGLFWHDSWEQLRQLWEDIRCAVGAHCTLLNKECHYSYIDGKMVAVQWQSCSNCGGIKLDTLEVE